jgi:hypothetical protein
MNIAVLDFETYWCTRTGYTLSKMTTEAYVRDPRFHAHMCGIVMVDGKTREVTKRKVLVGDNIGLALDSIDWSQTAALAHHAQFDGLILSHHYGIKPARWYDTLSMARAVHGDTIPLSIDSLAKHHEVGEKGKDIIRTDGVPRLTGALLHTIAGYCINDVDITWRVFLKLLRNFNRGELKLIDQTVRLFTEPVLQLNRAVLSDYIMELQANKADLLLSADAGRDALMSNEKFAELLIARGITPGRKVSPRTNKPTYAFAKTDPFMKSLLEHDDEEVQALAAARLGIKSTLAETRAQRMIDMGLRGPACIYLNYGGALQTHRHSGGDKMNWQNMQRGSKLRLACEAPPGHVVLVGDSSNIEARVLPAVAGQTDSVERFRRKEDPYCYMATKIFGHEVRKNDPGNPNWEAERFIGKTAVLGLGYGMGADKYYTTLQGKAGITLAFCKEVVEIFRETNDKVKEFWYECDRHLAHMDAGLRYRIGLADIELYTTRHGIILPNGLVIKYPGLKRAKTEWGNGWQFIKRKQPVHIYGAKTVENIVQALARIIVMDQAVAFVEQSRAAGYNWRLANLVHDEVVAIVPEKEADEAKKLLTNIMGTPPKWWPDLPVASEAGYAKNYRDAKK